MNKGCTYGVVTREKVNNHEKIIEEIKDSVVNLSNHYSKRLPAWATLTLTLLSSLAVGLIVYSLK
jgi:hypothetical protein